MVINNALNNNLSFFFMPTRNRRWNASRAEKHKSQEQIEINQDNDFFDKKICYKMLLN